MAQEIINLSPEQVVAAYQAANVNPNRIKTMNDKFTTIPDSFTAKELIFVDITVNGKVNKNIPAFRVGEDNSKYVLVGQIRSQYTDKKTASKISKEGDNKGKFLVVNNRYVNDFVEGLSEAEAVSYCLGKSFKAAKAKDYPVYQPEYIDGKPVYAETETKALEGVKPKSYRSLTIE